MHYMDWRIIVKFIVYFIQWTKFWNLTIIYFTYRFLKVKLQSKSKLASNCNSIILHQVFILMLNDPFYNIQCKSRDEHLILFIIDCFRWVSTSYVLVVSMQSVYVCVQLPLLLFPFPYFFLPSFLFLHLPYNHTEY